MRKIILIFSFLFSLLVANNAGAQCKAIFDYYITDTTNTYNFINYSTKDTSKSATYLWDFGNSKTDTSFKPIQTYTNKGSYKVCLTITAISPACKDTICQTIVANKTNPCNAEFTAVQDKSNSLKWNFAAIDTLENTYNWNLTSGNTTKKYNYTFPSKGIYTVALVVSNSKDHCLDSVLKSIKVKECSAAFDPQIDHATKTVTFINTSSSNMDHFKWTFENKDSSTLKNPTYKYSMAGSYSVNLTAYDSISKCRDSVKVPFIINGCGSNFNLSHYNNKLSYYTNYPKAVKIRWSFGDGNTSSKDSSYHYYSKYGTYIVSLTVYCSITDSSKSYDTIVLKAANCIADFQTKADSLNPHKVKFVNLSSASVSMQYKWDFGDGKTTTAKDSTHTYLNYNNYNVCLNISDPKIACNDNICKMVSVPGPCDTTITYSVKGLTLYYSVPNSLRNKTIFFGDGNFNNFTSGSFSYNYTKPNVYVVCLKVECNATPKCTTIVVKNDCKANFTYKADQANKYKLIFTNQSSMSPKIKYLWDFGDGNYSNDTNATNIYAKMGNYGVCLYIADIDDKCYDTICQTVYAFYPICDSLFTDTIRGDTLLFNYYANAQNVKWDFGDGETGTSKAGKHVYSKPGKYKVRLKVFCSKTDSSEYSKTITIKPECLEFFSPAIAIGQKFKLFLINKSPHTPTTRYLWDFGDGSYSTLRNPTHKYSNFSIFRICLTLKDSFSNINCPSFCDTINLDTTGILKKAGAWELVVIDEADIEDSTSGINKIVKSDFNIYPNPANSKITIDMSNATQHYDKIEIMNANGQVCITQAIDVGNELIEVDLERLNRGLYLIKLSNDERYSYKKMMKN